MSFTDAERAAMAAHQLALFEGRVITRARPSITDGELARVAARCAGPLPPALVALWRTSFGGRLDYDLEAHIGNHIVPFAFREIFYPDSDDYETLDGWMDQQLEFERESAEAAGQAHSGTLTFLPIGGFEYLERVFVQVAPGPNHGSVLLWKRGLPPTWRLTPHQDVSERVAPDLRGLFQQLVLEDDPAQPRRKYPKGEDTLRALELLAVGSPTGARAAQRLRGLLRETILDWREALAEGRLAQDARLCRLALREVAGADDLPALLRLEAAGCPLQPQVVGGGNALDLALLRGSLRVAQALRERGVSAANIEE